MPEAFRAAASEVSEKYPDLGAVGYSSRDMRCELGEEVVVAGQEQEVTRSTVWHPAADVWEVDCTYRTSGLAILAVAQATSAEGYQWLVDDSAAKKQPGNVQVEQSITVGQREFTGVSFEFPTNPGADSRVVVFYLDPETKSRARLEVHVDESLVGDPRFAPERLAADLGRHLDRQMG